MKSPEGFKGSFRTDLRARAAYSEGAGIYRILPAAVARPGSEADVAILLRWARRAGVALIPRGAGSAVTGSSVGEGVMVDLQGLPQPLDIDAAGATAWVGPAVRLAALNDAAAGAGLRLPPDPSSGAFATLGGMVSTDASGARSVRYHSIRPWVEEITFVSTDGERITLGRGQAPPAAAALQRFQSDAAPVIRAAREEIHRRQPPTRKNAFGYALAGYLGSGDILDLVIGSEGTLGIITGVRVRLAPIPPHRAGLRVSLAELDSLTEVVEALLPLGPSAVELLDRTFLDLVRAGGQAEVPGAQAAGQILLLVEFEGGNPKTLRGTVGDAVRRLRHLALDVETAIGPEQEAKLWALRHAASPIIARLPDERRSLQIIEDACVPVPRMGEYIRSVRAEAESLDIPVVIFGHAGDGNIHVNVLPDVTRTGWEATVLRLFERITARVLELGGTPSGEHGAGRLRAALLEQVYGAEVAGLLRRVKDAFDPAGIMNPGVIFPDTHMAFDRLKTGAGAAAIPEDIAAALRDIERSGGYARDRLDLAGPPA